MARRAELGLLAALVGALALAALLGRRSAPAGTNDDPRVSTRLAGPHGASGFAETLHRLGVTVTGREEPLFGLAAGTPPADVVVAVLAPDLPLGDDEVSALRDYVAQGGRLLLAGRTGAEGCFGYRLERRFGVADGATRETSKHPRQTFPVTHAVLRDVRPGRDTSAAGRRRDAPCRPLFPSHAEQLLWYESAVAYQLRFPSGGVVILVADAAILGNRALKETDAGPRVLGWFLAPRPRAMVFDEYHHGFQRAGSLQAAAWAWALRAPAGWALLQLAAAALLGLALAAVRFGPALGAVERRRRSPLEHLEALAAGLGRGRGQDTARHLLLGGLRRRLSRTDAGRTRGPLEPWLASLRLAARGEAAQRATARLTEALEPGGGDERVLMAARAVEDVWDTLRIPAPPKRS